MVQATSALHVRLVSLKQIKAGAAFKVLQKPIEMHGQLLKVLWLRCEKVCELLSYPIGSMYGIYANIWGILMVNVTIYGIHTDPMGTMSFGSGPVNQWTQNSHFAWPKESMSEAWRKLCRDGCEGNADVSDGLVRILARQEINWDWRSMAISRDAKVGWFAMAYL